MPPEKTLWLRTSVVWASNRRLWLYILSHCLEGSLINGKFKSQNASFIGGSVRFTGNFGLVCAQQ